MNKISKNIINCKINKKIEESYLLTQKKNSLKLVYENPSKKNKDTSYDETQVLAFIVHS